MKVSTFRNSIRDGTYNNIDELLYKLKKYYIDENKTIKQTSELLSISPRDTQWLKDYFGIKKDISTAHIGHNTGKVDPFRVSIENGTYDNYDKLVSDFKYYYLELNMTEYNTSIKLGLSKRQVHWLKNYLGIHKDQKSIALTRSSNAKKTFMSKYGVDNPWKVPEIIEQNKIKRANTWSNNYGVDHPWKLYEVQHSNREHAKSTNMERYGVEYACLSKKCALASGKKVSKINKYVADLFKKEGCSVDYEYSIINRSYDLLIDDTVLVEVNPTYTHNSTKGPVYNGHQCSPISSNYHYMKSKLAHDNGFKCIHIFDWDSAELISKILGHNKIRIYARNCNVVKLDNYKLVNEFLSKYHLQGALRYSKDMITLGLLYNNDIVSIMLLGKPRYSNKYEYEILRMCSNTDYLIVGGFQKLFKYFIRAYKPSSVISYCDLSKFDGTIYDKLGFRLISTSNPSCHWYNGINHYTNNLLMMQGADRLIGTNYGKGTSNKDIMRNHGYVEIYDCGQLTYIWSNS